MLLSKYSLRFICFLILTSSGACNGKKAGVDSGDSAIENNPVYKPLNDSIKKFPKDPLLYLRRANRLSQENAHELAYDDFLHAWEISRGLEVALPFAANLEILGKHLERLRLLDTLSHNFPENTQVSRLLAEAYASTGNQNQAMLQYDKMLAKDSLDPEILYEKALLLEQLNDTPGAIRALQSAYSLQGVDTYGLELAHLFAEQKNPKALEICNFILMQDSLRVQIDPFFIKGIYYANMKQYPKAIVQFDSCITRDWKTTDAYLEKGRAYFHMQNIQAAMQTFNMAITVTSTDADAYYWLGRCYEIQHRKMDAINSYQKAILLDRNFSEARQRIQILDSGFAHPSQ
jgi:tetratricopeptide (TPR) repeat protein